MIIFPKGISITELEYQCLFYLTANPEQWLYSTITEKARLRKEALMNYWRPRLFADPAVTDLPATSDALVALIMARPEYKTRIEADAELNPPELPYRHNIEKFATKRQVEASVTLFPTGIPISDLDTACILAYVQDLDDWILGALFGHINRARKNILANYQPILLADSEVETIPADEDTLLQMITERGDYQPVEA